MIKRPGLGIAAAVACGVAYGSNAPFASITASFGVPGAEVVFWRALTMLVVCTILVLALRRAMHLPREARLPVLILGLSTSLTSGAYLSSVETLPVAVATVVFYTFPVLVLLAGPLVEGERITARRLGVFAIAFVGVILVVGPASATLDPRGLGLALLASFGAAVMMFAGSRLGPRLAPEAAAVWVHLVIVPMTFVAMLVLGGPRPLPTSGLFMLALGIVIVSYIAGFLLQLLALKHVPAVVVSFGSLAEPPVAIVTAALVLGERLYATQYLGCAIVLVALTAAALVERRELEAKARDSGSGTDPAKA